MFREGEGSNCNLIPSTYRQERLIGEGAARRSGRICGGENTEFKDGGVGMASELTRISIGRRQRRRKNAKKHGRQGGRICLSAERNKGGSGCGTIIGGKGTKRRKRKGETKERGGRRKKSIFKKGILEGTTPGEGSGGERRRRNKGKVQNVA